MERPRIMVVEDEGIIAQDIKTVLRIWVTRFPNGITESNRQRRFTPTCSDGYCVKGDIDGIETAAECENASAFL
jgi:hypothetical protein